MSPPVLRNHHARWCRHDLLTNSGIGSAGGSGTFTFKSYSDSTISGTDTILYNTAAVSAGNAGEFDSSQVKFHIATGDAISLATGAGTGGGFQLLAVT